MALQDRIETLRTRHATIDQELTKEAHRPLPNTEAINDLKRQKLRIKDEIRQLEQVH